MDHLVGENIESKIMDDGVVSYGNGTGNATEKVLANGANPGSNCKSPLVDTVLAFIMHGLDTGTPANVQKIALTTFTVVEVRLEVKKLWEHCQFGEVPTKHTSRNRSEMSAQLDVLI